MIKVDIIITVNKKYWLQQVNCWINNHFGKNPKNGGNPPKDKKFINNVNFKIFLFTNQENNWFKWNNLKILNINVKIKDKKE